MLTSPSNRPRVAITMGDPSGIGPEVTIKALASPKVKGLADFFVIGDSFVMEKVSRAIGVKFKAELIDMRNVRAGSFSYGRSSAESGKASVEYLDRALELIKKRKAGCLVTAPINKSSVRLAGYSGFEGHTEYLAASTGVKDFAMMFVGGTMKITLVTRHIALKDVPSAISEDRIYRAIALTERSLKELFGIRSPRIAVSGLNPHAGEARAFGSEEEDIIAPAIRKASRKIKGVRGPIAPDVVFIDCLDKKFDACIAMYHDQGLIPFKLLHFKDGVNLTLGLPFVRTSPDHGTAFDIAGRGIADPASMIEAILLAIRLCRGHCERTK